MVDDLLAAILLPEWPAAELILHSLYVPNSSACIDELPHKFLVWPLIGCWNMGEEVIEEMFLVLYE